MLPQLLLPAPCRCNRHHFLLLVCQSRPPPYVVVVVLMYRLYRKPGTSMYTRIIVRKAFLIAVKVSKFSWPGACCCWPTGQEGIYPSRTTLRIGGQQQPWRARGLPG